MPGREGGLLHSASWVVANVALAWTICPLQEPGAGQTRDARLRMGDRAKGCGGFGPGVDQG